MRDEISSLAAGAGEAVEPIAKQVDLPQSWEELSFSVFSFRGGERPCFPYRVDCHRLVARARRFQGGVRIARIVKFSSGIGCALLC